MPRGMYKSKSLRKIFRNAPGNRVVVHYRKRKPNKARCAGCGNLLIGVPRERPYKMRKIPKSKKKPERPYGGYYCSKCMRKKIIEGIRG